MPSNEELEIIDKLRIFDDSVGRIYRYLVNDQGSERNEIRRNLIAILDEQFFSSDLPTSHEMYPVLRELAVIYRGLPLQDFDINHVYIDGKKWSFGELMDKLRAL